MYSTRRLGPVLIALALALLAALVVPAASAVTPARAAAPSVTVNTLGTDQITNGTTTTPVSGSGGWCLDDKSGGTANGTVIDIWQCDDNWGSQVWTVEADDTVRVQNHCMDVQGGSTSEGAAVLLDTCNGSGSPGEEWEAQSNGTLLNVNSGKCLGIDGGDPVSNGKTLFIWPCDGADTQVWHVPSSSTRGATAASHLQNMWNSSEDLFDTKGGCTSVTAPGGDCWWWSANEEDALVNFSINETAAYSTPTWPGAAQYRADLAATFAKYDPSPCSTCTGLFTHDLFNDDASWWGITWLNAYRLTTNPDYLELAENIFGYINSNGWDDVCGGGVWQANKTGSEKDAIATELYMELAAQLWRTTGQSSYQTLALSAWNWLKASMIVEVPEASPPVVATSADLANPNAHLLVVDAVSSKKGTTVTTSLCPPLANTPKWSYNQGVLIGALTDMDLKAPSSSYLDPAEAIANTVEADKQTTANQPVAPYSSPPLVDINGELSEPCTAVNAPYDWPDDCDIKGSTGDPAWLQFKGIFMRNLWCLSDVAIGSPSYTAFISANAGKIWYDDQNPTTDFASATDALNDFGFLWDNNGKAWPGTETNQLNEATQGSALDGLAANMGDTYGMC